jgi:hypothetical protein
MSSPVCTSVCVCARARACVQGLVELMTPTLSKVGGGGEVGRMLRVWEVVDTVRGHGIETA